MFHCAECDPAAVSPAVRTDYVTYGQIIIKDQQRKPGTAALHRLHHSLFLNLHCIIRMLQAGYHGVMFIISTFLVGLHMLINIRLMETFEKFCLLLYGPL